MNKKMEVDLYTKEIRDYFFEYMNEMNINAGRLNKILNLALDLYKDDYEIWYKLTYHFIHYVEDLNKENFDEFINNFELKMNRYFIYPGFWNSYEWARDYNDVYMFVNLNDYKDVLYYFNEDLKNDFIERLKSRVSLGDLENKVDDMDFEELMKELAKRDILENLPFNLEYYINWEYVVYKAMSGNFIVEYWFGNTVIVESD